VTLTVHQREVLEFERRFPRHTNAKSIAVSEFFQLTMSAYESDLDAIVALPEAHEYDPALVREIARQRRGMRWYAERHHYAGEWH
jgi:hypothetical protein